MESGIDEAVPYLLRSANAANFVTSSRPAVLVGRCTPGGLRGADSSESELSGQWHALIPAALAGADVQIDADLHSAVNAKDILLGTVTMNTPQCFNNGMATGMLNKTSVMLLASGGGTLTQASTVTITGELAGGKITGLFSMSSAATECGVSSTPITLQRR